MTNENPPDTPLKKRGRPPKGKVAMTAAERAARHREYRRRRTQNAEFGRASIEKVVDAWLEFSGLTWKPGTSATSPEVEAAYHEMIRMLDKHMLCLGLRGSKQYKNFLKRKKSTSQRIS